MTGNGNYGLMTGLIIKTNLVQMFDAESLDNIEGSLTKNLKKETKDHQTMPQ